MPGNRLNVRLFYETLGRILSNKFNQQCTLVSLENTKTGETVYKRAEESNKPCNL